MPMIDKRSWPKYTGFELRHDPDQIHGKGRPKSKRIDNKMDERKKKRNSCRYCGSESHNTKTCNSRKYTSMILYNIYNNVKLTTQMYDT